MSISNSLLKNVTDTCTVSTYAAHCELKKAQQNKSPKSVQLKANISQLQSEINEVKANYSELLPWERSQVDEEVRRLDQLLRTDGQEYQQIADREALVEARLKAYSELIRWGLERNLMPRAISLRFLAQTRLQKGKNGSSDWVVPVFAVYDPFAPKF